MHTHTHTRARARTHTHTHTQGAYTQKDTWTNTHVLTVVVIGLTSNGDIKVQLVLIGYIQNKPGSTH